MTQRQAAALAGISDARWRQLVTGYQSVGQGNYAPLTARAETLARMAAAVGVTPEQLTAVDREDAAAVLLRLQRERNEAAHQVGSGTLPVGSGVQPLDLSELSPEDQEYVLGLVERLRRQRGE